MLWNITYTEIRCRERHFTEYAARIAHRRLNTLLVGNCVLCSLNYELTGANKSYDREKSDRYRKVLFCVVTKRTAELATNALGNIATAAGKAAHFSFLKYASSENNGLNNLNNRLRQVVCAVDRLRASAKACATSASEHL